MLHVEYPSVYDFPQSRAFMNSSSVNDSSLAASKCICTQKTLRYKFEVYEQGIFSYKRGAYLLFFENVDQLELFLETHNEFCFLLFEHFVLSKKIFFTLMFLAYLVLF